MSPKNITQLNTKLGLVLLTSYQILFPLGFFYIAYFIL